MQRACQSLLFSTGQWTAAWSMRFQCPRSRCSCLAERRLRACFPPAPSPRPQPAQGRRGSRIDMHGSDVLPPPRCRQRPAAPTQEPASACGADPFVTPLPPCAHMVCKLKQAGGKEQCGGSAAAQVELAAHSALLNLLADRLQVAFKLLPKALNSGPSLGSSMFRPHLDSHCARSDFAAWARRRKMQRVAARRRRPGAPGGRPARQNRRRPCRALPLRAAP